MILVTGATGTVGSEVLACLLPDHAGEVRALTRNPDAVFPACVVDQLASSGVPAEPAHAVVELLRASQEPFNSVPTKDITTVTGQPARTFSDWADAHRTTFLDPPTTW